MDMMKTNNVIMENETYETPECNVINLEVESAILGQSYTDKTGSATHDGFVEEDYIW